MPFTPCEKYPHKCPAGTEVSEGNSNGVATFGIDAYPAGVKCQRECRVAGEAQAKQHINHDRWAILNGHVVNIGG